MSNPFANMMNEVQKMQETLKKNQAEMENLETKGEAGAGLVSVLLKGRYVEELFIDDSALKESKSVLIDLIKAAFNDGIKKQTSMNSNNVQNMLGGLNLPPNLDISAFFKDKT